MDYQNGYRAIADVLPTADAKVAIFQNYYDKWGFYLPPQYDVRLTLYGPGGSYDPKTGTIVIMTTKEGVFKRGKNPLETMLHEAVHIGIENTIVSKYGLSHWTKERIVDQFMIRHFMDVCPDYRMQSNAETDIDIIFWEADTWDNLPERVRRYASRWGREKHNHAMHRIGNKQRCLPVMATLAHREMKDLAKIRPGTHEDSADIASLMAQLGYPCTPAEMEQRLDRLSLLESEEVLVAERAGQMLGVCSVHLIPLLHESGNVGRITALVVRANVRGQGIGRRLVQEAESWAWSHDCVRMEVTSGDHRPDAHRFYEACGFKYDERRFLKRKS